MRQHRQQEKEEEAGVGSHLHRVLLTCEKQLRTHRLTATLVSPLTLLLFLPLRAPASPRQISLCHNRAREQDSTSCSSCTCSHPHTGYFYCYSALCATASYIRHRGWRENMPIFLLYPKMD